MKLTILFIIGAVIAAVTADYASIYHKQVRLDDAFCGVPSSSWTGSGGWKERNGRKKRGSIVINTWRPRHSYVKFRDQCFEWGDDIWYYRNGGVGRNDNVSCQEKWGWYKGQSRCTREQAERLGAWYARNNTYWLLFNNCHNFAQWFINRLLQNRCEI